ncbi:DUF1700 domain-containing protein [Asticcacaulis sp. AC402]|uniref:DUF1700 domain-containing protein n=1 Tax=Asticcacaulis sp. AC402 TaxID=1282361 RepID=UPI0003C3D29D|nr:DUF1700 domain-containing protein [Asticcacaulis sp. AC402]ESQ76120.1 membrane protein [Asticcacaulis sp. AC402]
MTKDQFIERLKAGLKGLKAEAIADIVADYEAHFAEAAAAGRSEAEVAAALGDPGRLARELKAEAGMKNWESAKSPSSAAGAILGIIGLGALDILVLLPILGGVVGTLIGVFTAAIGIFIAGGVLFAAGPFTPLPGGVAAAMLGGVGVMAGAAALGALTAVLSVWLVNGLIWYGRLHYRVLKPALEN